MATEFIKSMGEVEAESVSGRQHYEAISAHSGSSVCLWSDTL